MTATSSSLAERPANVAYVPRTVLVYRTDGAVRDDVKAEQAVEETQISKTWEDYLNDVARSQDRAAFEKLFFHFAPRVKAYLLKLGSDAGQAEDLMQEVMAQVWRKAKLYDDSKAGAATWIFTIARNLRIDAFRRDRRPEIDENDPALMPEPERPADQTLHAREVSSRLQDIVAQLPEEQKTVVVMSFYEDKAHAAIAEELGIPLGTVKSRLRLAMGKIKTVWGDAAGVTL